MWKANLRQAIDSGKLETTPAVASLDSNCEFGKWLYSDPSLKNQAGPHYEKVRQLHADFHKEVGKILSLVAAGKREEAMAAIALNTNFANLSTALTKGMLDWSQS